MIFRVLLLCLLAGPALSGPRPDWAQVWGPRLDPVGAEALERIDTCLGAAYDARDNPLDCIGVLMRDCPGTWDGAFAAKHCEEAVYRAWMFRAWDARDALTQYRGADVRARVEQAFDLWETWMPLHCADALASVLPFEDGADLQERRCRIEQAALQTISLTFTYLP